MSSTFHDIVVVYWFSLYWEVFHIDFDIVIVSHCIYSCGVQYFTCLM